MKTLRHWIAAALLLLGAGLANLAAAAEVLLGPGDVVRLSVYGSPDLSVETRVSEGGAITFPLLGQVNRPGRYPVEGRRKVLDLLAMAGGVSAEGSDLISLVRTRDGKTQRETIDIVDMVRRGELDKDVEVAGGDIIFVERAPRAYVTGEVQRPGAFRIERGMTVLQAISAGGGLTPRGSDSGMRITRRDPDGRAVTLEARASDPVQVDDVITVRESWF